MSFLRRNSLCQADPIRLALTSRVPAERENRLTATLLVNPPRPRPGGWRLVLWASWSPAVPHVVRLDLQSKPNHPSLPTGRWLLPQPVLRQGLDAPVWHDDVSLHPDIEGERVWLTAPCADRPWQAAVSRRRLGAFLDAISRRPLPSASAC